MKIAQVAPLTEAVPPKLYGGTERVVAYLTDALVELGHEVVLFASGDSQTKAELAAIWPRALRLDPNVKDYFAPVFMELETVGATERFSTSVRSLGCECASFPGGRIKLVLPEHIEARDLYRIASEQNVQIRRMHLRRDSLEDNFLRAMDTEGERPAHVHL